MRHVFLGSDISRFLRHFLALFSIFFFVACTPSDEAPTPISITAISPSSGDVSGGYRVTISGTGFSFVESVLFGTSPCILVNTRENQIECTVPETIVAGAVEVTVRGKSGRSGSSVFTYVMATPVITSISPDNGALGGNTSVFINGSNFVSDATVSINGVPCTDKNVLSSTMIECNTPAQAAGSYTLTVTNPNGMTGTSPVNYTYNAFPVVSAVTSPSPAAGPTTGGTTLIISGTGFLPGMRIQLGSSLCGTVNVTSSMTASCVTGPATAGVTSISVMNVDLQSGSLANAFTFYNQPSVSSISPEAGALAGGTNVFISGTYFTPLTTVSIGALPCSSLTYLSSTLLECVTPAQPAGTYPVNLANPGTNTYIHLPGFTHQGAPTVTSITPSAGPLAGRSVVIAGSGFNTGITVSIGGANCAVTARTATSITCTASANSAGTYNVVVLNTDGQNATLTNGFSYQAAPIVTSITAFGSSPAAGPLAGGTSITINGTNFFTGATVTVGTNACGVTSVTGTAITCSTPANALLGSYNVSVTNTDGQSVETANGFTYITSPTLGSVNPTGGALAGGTTITLTGSAFFANANVTVGGATCTSVSVTDASSLTCVTPTLPAGAYDITVTNIDGQSATLAAAYTYQAAPTISSIAPANGRSVGGDAVVITGTNFLAGATVSLGGVACTPTAIAPTTIDCTTGARAAATVAVTVTNTDNQAATLAAGYVYDPAPVITSLSTNAASSAGGTAIVISGTDFVSGATVSVGTVPCATVTFVSATTLNCTTDADTSGVKSITVTNPDTQSFTLASAITVYDAPTISAVTPSAGALAGGTAIVITGTNFATGVGMTIGGVPCMSFTFVNATTLNCITPARAAGAQPVVVTNPDSSTGTSSFTYQPAPTVASLSVTNGPSTGGTSLTINGTGFVTGMSVDFGGSACTVTADTATTITCTTSAHAPGTVTVTVTNADGQLGSLSSAFTYDPPPVIANISPILGPASGGTSLTINGSNFVSGATVDISGNACAVITTTASVITCNTGARAAGTYTLTVTNPDGQVSNTYSSYRYIDPPAIAGINPSGGPLTGGTTITISGTDFIAGAQVTVNGVACMSVTFASATSLLCVTPASASAGAATVVVTNIDGQSATDAVNFTYAAPPTISYVTPSLGPIGGGTSVTVIGTGFSPTAVVRFGTNTATCTFNSSVSFTCTTPLSLLTGGVSVTVTNPDTQVGTLATGFVYLPPPTISSVSPDGAPVAGGNLVTVTGTNFISGATVSVGGSACTSVTFVSSTTLRCLAPSGTAGTTVSVVVTNTDGQTATLAGSFSYRNPPTITSVSPSNGHFSGGTTITVNGTNFYTGTTVKFGTYTCTPTSITSTQITCTTAAAPVGNYTATILNLDGQSVTSASNVYSYRGSPLISNVSPNYSLIGGGTVITVNGSGFFNGDLVAIGGTGCSSTTWVSANQMQCTSPAMAAGTYAVTVTSPDRVGTLSNAVTYRNAPTVTSVSPSSGVQAGNTAIAITGTNFATGATVTIGAMPCSSVVLVSSTSITCRTPSGSAGAQTLSVTNTDTQSGTSTYTYTAIPIVAFQTGTISPNPPNPDNYGSTTTNITHTFTVKNIGEGPTTGTLSVTISGVNPGAFLKGTDTCTGNDLAVNASCTIQVSFLGAFLSTGSYAASLNVSALTTGGTTTNSLQGAVP